MYPTLRYAITETFFKAQRWQPQPLLLLIHSLLFFTAWTIHNKHSYICAKHTMLYS